MLTHVAVRNPGDIATSGLAYSAFARHYLRNLGWCLFLALLRCFSSGGSPHTPIWFSVWYPKVGFPIRKSPDLSSFAAPRSLSQLVTSFIGSWCQGIPLALLLAWSLDQVTIEKSKYWFSSYVELCRLIFKILLFSKNCNFYPVAFLSKRYQKFPLLLPSHNCIIIHNVQFSRYTSESFALICNFSSLRSRNQFFRITLRFAVLWTRPQMSRL